MLQGSGRSLRLVYAAVFALSAMEVCLEWMPKLLAIILRLPTAVVLRQWLTDEDHCLIEGVAARARKHKPHSPILNEGLGALVRRSFSVKYTLVDQLPAATSSYEAVTCTWEKSANIPV